MRDFQRRLARLDRELDAAVAERATRLDALRGSFGALVEWMDPVHLRALADRLESLRFDDRADDFGLDPAFLDWVSPFFELLYRRWWRVEVEGLAHVPARGPALLVANHAGAMFPWDAAMLKVALRTEHPARREVRPLADDFVFRLPFAAGFVARVGGVRACHENAERLLGAGEVVSVFPEGVRGMAKPFSERYRLRRFGRGGFVRLALRTGVPVVPVAIVGAEEAHPLLARWEWPARLLGVPYLPITPTFPWLGWLGLVPLPSRWRIAFGAPLDWRAHGPQAASDDALVERLATEVRERVAAMLEDQLDRRGPAF